MCENADRRGGVRSSYFFKRSSATEQLSLCAAEQRSTLVAADSAHPGLPLPLPARTKTRPPRRRSLPVNFPCCFPSDWPHLGAAVCGPYRLQLARLLRSGSPAPSHRLQRDSRSAGSWPGSPARMEGDVMDKVDKVDKVEEATATVRDFDPISGSIPATKVEITVSCRWAPFFLGLSREDSF